MADWVDFTQVKSEVSMEMALNHYGIQLRKVNATSLRGKCPLPTHTGEGEASFSANTDKNAWACHAASCVALRDGRKGGNVLDFVSVMEGCSIRDAALELQDWFSIEASNERPTDYVPSRDRKGNGKKLAAEKKDEGSEEAKADTPPAPDDTAPDADEVGQEVNQPLEFKLKSIDSSHEYFRKRGIKEATAEHFGAGYFYGKGSMAGRCVIPIFSPEGELIPRFRPKEKKSRFCLKGLKGIPSLS